MFGINGKNQPKKVAVNNTTESLAIDFLKRAIGSIEAQLKIEVERNGFSLEDLKSAKVKLERVVVESETDSRFKGESFSIVSGKVNRLIMAVKWTPNGFTIERHSDQVAEAIKQNPNFAVKKGDFNKPDLVLNATKREIEIEARAAHYREDYLKNFNKN
jgi:hypothetical protein